MLAIHETRTSTQSDIEEYDDMLYIICLQVGWMMNILARGLSLKHTYKLQAIHICAPIIENKTLDPITASSTL